MSANDTSAEIITNESEKAIEAEDPLTVRSSEDLFEENQQLRKKVRIAQYVVIVLAALVLIAVVCAVGVVIHSATEKRDGTQSRACGTAPQGQSSEEDILDEPEHPGPFHDLTSTEMRKVRQFLEKDIGVVKPEVARPNDSHIYVMDLEPPKKAETLAYLDNNASSPPRYARVILFRGDLVPPLVEERLCGPLPKITSCPVDVTMPFSQRPMEGKEYNMYHAKLMPEIHNLFGEILQESFGGSFDYENCEDDCFNYYNFPVASSTYSNDMKRRMWVVPMYDYPYISLHPVDFGVLCDIDGVDQNKFSVEKVWYAGHLYSSPQEFIDAYNNGSIHKIHMSYPTKEEVLFATLKQRGPPKPTQPKRPPQLIEPDGKRYTVRHRKVEYLDMWSFNYRVSPVYGPVLNDIRFLGERIAYEIALGEIMVFYSGDNPMQRQVFFVDSFALTGSRSKVLLAGADCPTTATFLPLTVTSQGREEPVVFPRSICIFEQNLGTPLRRHHNYGGDEGAPFYGGMLDSALVVRSIHAVDNYDYVIDFTFHQNGALGVSVGQTGYILSSYYTLKERPYGVKLMDHIFGALHLHVANFKVDLDINGTSNRYETLDIKEETVQLRQATNAEYTQTKFSFNLKKTENEALYNYDFEKPMYHIFHNDEAKNKYGERKAYRLSINGMAKQLLRKNIGVEGSQPWARHQLAVTRQKDSERTSGNPYSQWNGAKKPMDFEAFTSDNEKIVDKDLVAWVTLGVHHIPHSEDLPVTTTAGKHQSFHLSPYNYFPECPSMMSRDAVYAAHADEEKPAKGLLFEYYGTGDVSKYKDGGACQYKPYDTSAVWRSDPDSMFETNENTGVL